jgi:hypothetical protein
MEPIDSSSYSMTLAEKLSVFPVTQQIVGLGTVLSNTAKVIYDIFNKITTPALGEYRAVIKQLEEAKTRTEINKFFNGINIQENSPKARVWKWYKDSNDKNKNPLSENEKRTPEKSLEYVKKQIKKEVAEPINKDLTQHIKYIAIGFFRAIPIAATIYYAAKWTRVSKFEQYSNLHTLE